MVKPVYCARPHQYQITKQYIRRSESTVLTIDWRHVCILSRFLHNHGNIATEGSPMSELWHTLIERLQGFMGGGPRVVVSTAAFHARVRGSVPGLGGLKETKLFLPHPRVKVSIVGSLRDREVACSASDRQGSNFESCVWRTVSSQSSHHPQEVLLAQFSLYVHKGGLKPDSFHFFSRVHYCALYHKQHRTLQAFEHFGAVLMHNLDDKYPTRPGFEPSTFEFEPQSDRMSHRGRHNKIKKPSWFFFKW